jgi:hypothetical protein
MKYDPDHASQRDYDGMAGRPPREPWSAEGLRWPVHGGVQRDPAASGDSWRREG